MQLYPAGYPIQQVSGPLIIGYLLHWGLFGTLSVQLYLYYLAFPNDEKSTKCLVYGIYVVEFVQTMLVTHDAFAEFGYGFGNIDALTGIHHDGLTVPIMGTVVAGVGQLFYAYRILILSGSRIIPIFISFVSLISSVAAIITGAYCFQTGNITDTHNTRLSIVIGVWGGAAALCDVLIAICITYYLTRYDAGIRQTQIIVTKLIHLIIETGTVTAAAALVNLVLFFAFPHQALDGTTAFIIPKLYANTIYMVLNSRFRIMGGRDTYTS
ncbi:hypothetical protein IW261DRAFT_1363026, partial [Armillaria novae-zelandiae]